MKKTISIGVSTLLGVAGALAIGSTAAQAAPSTQPLTCDGQMVLARTNNNNSSQMGGWSSAQIVAGGTGHLIPTVFDFSAYDNTTDQPIFAGAAVKGAGSANHNQPTVTCTQSQTGTLADLIQPGDPVPPGAALTDQVTTTVTATAIWQK